MHSAVNPVLSFALMMINKHWSVWPAREVWRVFALWATNVFSFLLWVQESRGWTEAHFYHCLCSRIVSASSGSQLWSCRMVTYTSCFQMNPSNVVGHNCKLIHIFELLLDCKEQELFYHFLQRPRTFRSDFKLVQGKNGETLQWIKQSGTAGWEETASWNRLCYKF